MYSRVFQGWFNIPITTASLSCSFVQLIFQYVTPLPCPTNLFSSMASRMLGKSSRWPRQLPQEMGKTPLRHHRLRRFISLHYLPQVRSSLRIRPPNPGPRPQTAPPGNLSIMPASSGDQASPQGDNAGTPVPPQDLAIATRVDCKIQSFSW